MEKVKKYGMLALKFLGFFLIGSFILSVFNYFFMSSKTVHVIGLVFLILLFLIFSFKEARISTSRGIVTGLKVGLFLNALLIFINLILFQSSFKFLRLVYYIILLFSSILGSIIGVNTKKE